MSDLFKSKFVLVACEELSIIVKRDVKLSVKKFTKNLMLIV